MDDNCVHLKQFTHAPQWNALLFGEWDSRGNREEVRVLKIQEPGRSYAVWAKNSTVLLPHLSQHC